MASTDHRIIELLYRKKFEEVKEIVKEMPIYEIVDVIKKLEIEEMAIVFRLLEKETALNVFEQLDTSIQQRLINSFTEDKTIEIMEDLAPDDRVRLLEELPAKVAKKLITSLSPEEREKTAGLLGYGPETAGRVMTPDYIRLKGEMTVEEALAKIRETSQDTETIYTLFVTDDQRKLLGVISLKQLVLGKLDDKVKDLMTENYPKVFTDTDQEEAARLVQETDLLAVPVVDSEKRLVGIITVDDAMDIIEEETTEDIFDKAGLMSAVETNRSYKLIAGSLLDIWKVRIPFLLITLFGGLAAGVVIGSFEESLETIAAVAIFIPVVMDMGGNVGTQSSTIFARAFILGHIKKERFYSHLFKEVKVGLTMGIILGFGAGLIARLWQGIPGIGYAVGLAVFMTITLASFLGFFIPFILNRFGIDQAAGADPIITTIKDITGLLIYFLLVNIFLGYML